MTDSQEIKQMREDIEMLQYRMGGAEYLVKYLTQQLSEDDLRLINKEISEAITNFGEDSTVAKILNESLRILSR